jgi:putative ABC transport system permease protein
MLYNYLLIALRVIRVNKISTMINVLGLAVGLATFALIMLWVQDELNYDRFNVQYDHLYRVVENQYYAGGDVFPVAVTPSGLAAKIKEEYPEIKKASRLTERWYTVRQDEKIFSELFTLVDPDFLSMFTIDLVKGDKATALSNPQSILLTEEMASKYFGNQDPVGHTLNIDGKGFIVTGVMKNFPSSSHMNVKSVIPFVYLKSTGSSMEDWGSNAYYTYVLLAPETPLNDFNIKIRDLIKRNNKGAVSDIYLQPVGEIHLYAAGKFTAEIGAQGDIRYVRALALIAFFILLIACINFMNLSTAQSARRAKEVGMRKVTGANRTKLILQFLGESIILVFIGYALAMVAVEALIPWFSNLTGKVLVLRFFTPQFAGTSLLIILLTGIVAGSYPAFFISSFDPMKVLKGLLRTGPGSSNFRRTLVTSQFAISVVLIIVTLIVTRQLTYIQNKKLGYDRGNLVYSYFGEEIRLHMTAFKQDMLSDQNILSVTTTDQIPTYIGNSTSGWTWEGKSTTEEVLMHMVMVDEDYLKTFKIELAEGRFYSSEMMNDTSDVVVNQTAAHLISPQGSPVGKFLSIGPYRLNIIGVVKDFHFKSVHRKIEPLVLVFLPKNNNIVFARISPLNRESSLKHMETTFKKYAGDQFYSYHFLDDDFENLYKAEKRMSKIFSYFAILAIFISCLGLFGLSLFTAEQKTKEIGIRKAMGASLTSLVWLFLSEYLKWVALATMIAIPLAWYAMVNWLGHFAYRIHLRPWEFLIAAMLAFLIAMFTVSYQALRSAGRNPAYSLKYE